MASAPPGWPRDLPPPVADEFAAKVTVDGKLVAEGDKDQATLKAMMKSAGFGHVDVHNLTGGVVALHAGIKC